MKCIFPQIAQELFVIELKNQMQVVRYKEIIVAKKFIKTSLFVSDPISLLFTIIIK